LYLGGTVFLTQHNPKKTLSMYLVGGLAGLMLFIVLYNILPALEERVEGSRIMGASGCVMALFVAATIYNPKSLINLKFFQIPVWIIAVLYVLRDISYLKLGDNLGGLYAHLGGAAYGFIWASQIKQGKNIGQWMERLVDRLANLFKKGTRARMKVVKNEKRGGKSDAEYNVEKKANQAKVDAILDKISKSGYDSLTKTEKDILFKQGDR